MSAKVIQFPQSELLVKVTFNGSVYSVSDTEIADFVTGNGTLPDDVLRVIVGEWFMKASEGKIP